MHAVVCREYGEPDVLAVEEVAPPALEPGTVRIAVRAAGVGFAHALMVRGTHQNKAPLPFTPGTEAAGEVLDCGAGVELFKTGDRVLAGVRDGAFAEQIAAPEDTVFAMPAAMSFEEAVHFPTIYAAAYGSLKSRANLRPGETLLVMAAGGGSGLAAVEIGKSLGARVIAAASSDARLEVAAERGADVGINYADEDLRERVLELSGGRGCDVVLESVGGELFEACLRAIAPEGRLIVFGFSSGTVPQIPANILLVKNITVIGVYWGYYMGWARQERTPGTAEQTRAAMAELTRWYEEGRLKPLVGGRYTLAQAGEAVAAIQRREVIGKPVLLP